MRAKRKGAAAGAQKTHYDGCEEYHIECALARLRAAEQELVFLRRLARLFVGACGTTEIREQLWKMVKDARL